MDEKLLRLKTQTSIQRLMEDLVGDCYEKQSKKVIRYDEYEKISRLQMWQGVRAFLLECNIEHGSTHDVDLYKLALTYLWNKNARTEINAVIERHGY
jgi:hypothetical protein